MQIKGKKDSYRSEKPGTFLRQLLRKSCKLKCYQKSSDFFQPTPQTGGKTKTKQKQKQKKKQGPIFTSASYIFLFVNGP